MEIIPVAITRAKYPGNRSSAVRKKTFRWLIVELFIEGFGFFVASLAIKFKADARGAAFLRQNPSAGSQRRIVSQVLAVPTFQDCAPMIFVISVKTCDLLLHRSVSRT